MQAPSAEGDTIPALQASDPDPAVQDAVKPVADVDEGRQQCGMLVCGILMRYQSVCVSQQVFVVCRHLCW